jgi:putative DNA primase/helicase
MKKSTTTATHEGDEQGPIIVVDIKKRREEKEQERINHARLHPPRDKSKQQQPKPATGIHIAMGTDIEPENTSWLWEGWLPLGALTILAGKPGCGKTTLTLALAATVTIGGRWPDGTHAEKGMVLIWSGEDSLKSTIVPRLMCCGADMSMVRFVMAALDEECQDGRRPFDPSKDMEELLKELDKMPEKPALVIIDSISSTVSGDGNKNTDVRRGLQPTVDIAEKIECSMLGITHFTKNSKGSSALDRVTGSLAFGALARMVLVAGRVQDGEDEEEKLVMARAKSNLGPASGGFEYEIRLGGIPGRPEYEHIENTYILWGGAINGHADDIMERTDNRQTGEDRELSTECAKWLDATLRYGGMMKHEIVLSAKKEGYTEVQLKFAAKKVGIFSEQVGYPAKARWSIADVKK